MGPGEADPAAMSAPRFALYYLVPFRKQLFDVHWKYPILTTFRH